MEAPLRILHLEDDVDYAALVEAWLRAAGIKVEITVVQDLESFRRAQEDRGFDLILSEYHLPSCTGLEALAVARQWTRDTSLVLVSGTAGEDAAIESLRQGAADYVLKQWIDRLVPVIQRALHQARKRQRLRAMREDVSRRERWLQALIENVLDLRVLLYAQGRITYTSPSTALVLGYPQQGLTGQDWFEFVHPEDVGLLQGLFESKEDPESWACRTDFRMCQRDRRWRRLEAVLRNRMKEPDLAGLGMTCRDVTERKQAELRASALARLGGQLRAVSSWIEADRAIANAAADLLVWDAFVLSVWDAESQTLSTVLAVDTLCALRVELPPEPAPHRHRLLARRVLEEGPQLLLRDCPLTRPTETHMFGDLGRPSASLLWAPIRHAGQVEGVLSVQSHQFRAYGEQELEISVLLADHHSGALTRLRAEQALRRAEQRHRGQFENSPEAILVWDLQGRILDANAAAGELQRGSAASFVGRSWLDFVPPEQRAVAGEAAERAANLTRQLLTFSRRQVLQPRTVDLNELVHPLSQLPGRFRGEHIVLRLQFSPQPAWVMAVAGMIEQVVLSLAVNARDAMAEGGRLDLRVRLLEVEPGRVERYPQARRGPAVELSVTDTGCGISLENLKRIFEPFFTPKELGEGTGLGLATVHGMVEQQQGWIEVESRLGEGTTFRVYLSHQVAAEPTAQSTESTTPGPNGRETILVVEDEPSVRELVAMLLEHHGYRVLQAANGPEALELWQRHGEKVDLLLTDLVMPRRMNGRQLAERLWQDRPDLKVIFTSGYSAEVVGCDFALRPGLVYLQKPYPPGRLVQLVRQTLEGTVAAA